MKLRFVSVLFKSVRPLRDFGRAAKRRGSRAGRFADARKPGA